MGQRGTPAQPRASFKGPWALSWGPLSPSPPGSKYTAIALDDTQFITITSESAGHILQPRVGG